MKYRLDRKSLEKLYIRCIRSMLKYGELVWDTCDKGESDLIDCN